MKLKSIIKAIIYCILIIGLVSCIKDISSIKTKDELLKEYGVPTYVGTIILKDDIGLYEYQGGLYNFIPENDSLTVIENIYKTCYKTTAIWYVPLDSDSIRVIDNLTWSIFVNY